MSGLDHQTQIGWQSSVVGSAGGFVVLVGRWNVVRELSWSLLNLSLVVGLGVIFVLFGQCFGFVGCEDGSDEGSVWDPLEGVARGANLAVYLESTSEGLVIIGLVPLDVLPWVCGGVKTVMPSVPCIDLPSAQIRSYPSSAGVMACAGRPN